jgi:hypothetical protein
MDNGTLWWYLAEKEKFAYAVFWQDHTDVNFTTVNHSSSVNENIAIIADKFIEDIKSLCKLDEERIYLTGHSAGSGGVTLLAKNPQKFAGTSHLAGGGTNSFVSSDASGIPLPVHMFVGEMEVNLVSPWTFGVPYSEYLLKSWGIDKGEIKHESTAQYKFEDTIGKKEKTDSIHGRWTWSWSIDLGIDIPVFKFSHIANRAHDTFVACSFWGWDYLSKFKVTQNSGGTQKRFYSPSGFKVAGDEVMLVPQDAVLSSVAAVNAAFKGGVVPSGTSVGNNGVLSFTKLIENDGTLLENTELASGWTIVDCYPKVGDGWELSLSGGKIIATFNGVEDKEYQGDATIVLKDPSGAEKILKVSFTGEKTKDIWGGCNATGLSFLVLALFGLMIKN